MSSPASDSNVLAIGECMLEITGGRDLLTGAPLSLGYGGDTLNTAVHLARQGIATSYLTALGEDRYSEWLLREWQREGIDTRNVLRLPGKRPGLYWVSTDEQGERSFAYWRSASAARSLCADRERVAYWQQAYAGVRYAYFSGITLSLFDDRERERLWELLHALQRTGTQLCFDANYRPAGWPSLTQAREALARGYAVADIALPTFDDEAALFGDSSAQACAQRLHDLGSREVVVKLGADGCLLSSGNGGQRIPVPQTKKPVDTTGAGDAFNAGYLAARCRGIAPVEAAEAGHRLAGNAIMQTGALGPRDDS